MGKALYRQYRSTSFDEVIGQDHITTTLKNSLESRSIGHAYLLTGPRGVGKTSIARIFAHKVNDLPYSKDNNHLDIIEIDAASNRRIDEIRSLRERVHIAPTSAKYKVYIIDEVHMLTREAFNALLKTLEEPPEHAIFILATTDSHKLPDTIISRCITFTFHPISQKNLVSHLKSIAKNEKINITNEALGLLALHGDGSFRDSISLLDQVKHSNTKIDVPDIERALGLAPSDVIEKILNAVASSNPQSLSESLQTAYNHGANEVNLTKQISAKLRDDLLSGKPQLSSDETLQLLQNLLDVPSSPKPRAKLELCLLEPLFNRNKISGVTVNVQPQVTEIPVAPATNSAKAEDDTAEQAAATLTVDTELWDSVLNKLKTKNNTLYGIARMAKAELQGETLQVCFKFAFHFKQVNQAKNKALITDIIQELGHKGIEVNITLLDKKDDPVKSITNIFGHGEVLES